MYTHQVIEADIALIHIHHQADIAHDHHSADDIQVEDDEVEDEVEDGKKINLELKEGVSGNTQYTTLKKFVKYYID